MVVPLSGSPEIQSSPPKTNEQKLGTPPIFHLRGIPLEVGIEFFHTLRADAVAEFCFRMIPDVSFDLVPIPLVIPYLFA